MKDARCMRPWRAVLSWALVTAAAGTTAVAQAPHSGAMRGAHTTSGAKSGTAKGSVVSGTVTVTGARTNADVVVSLAAPGLVLKPPKQPIPVDQKGFQFIPRVLAVVRGTTVRFLNNDPEDHNVYSPEGEYNLGTWAPGETREQVFDRTGVFTQLCRIHPDMQGYIVVLETPYFAVTDATGRFEIRNVAAGAYIVKTWGRRLRPVERPVTVERAHPLTIDFVLTR